MAAALQLTQALAQCSITCSGARGSSEVRSAKETRLIASAAATSSRSLSSALWGGSVPQSRKVKGSTDLAGKRSVRRVSAVFLDDDYEESEEEIRAGYEALYGKPFGQSNVKKRDSFEDKDGEGDDEAGGGRGRRGGEKGRREDRGGGRGARSDFEERVVQIRRVTKVVKGGKQLSFRAVVIVGDKKGKVGVGVNKAKEVITAVQKAALNAKRNLVAVPMTKYKTFPHRADGYYGAAHVMLRPAAVGTGVIAGGAVRVVLELAGYENALGKQIRAENPLNNARAVVQAVTGMKTFRQVSADRGIPMEELWK